GGAAAPHPGEGGGGAGRAGGPRSPGVPAGPAGGWGTSRAGGVRPSSRGSAVGAGAGAGLAPPELAPSMPAEAAGQLGLPPWMPAEAAAGQLAATTSSAVSAPSAG